MIAPLDMPCSATSCISCDIALGDEYRRLGHGRVRHEPVHGAARGFLDVDARQQKLDECELRVRLDSMDRRQRRGNP